MTQKDQFIDFLKHSTKLADRTQKHYIWALSNIDNTIARIKNVDTFDIYQVQDIQELDEIIGALKQDDELKNNRERGKYIAALKKYRELISGSNPVMSNNEEQNKGVDSRQIIFFGTPGSGKSYKVNELIKGKKFHRTTFHPDSDYASFVGCYKPTMSRMKLTMSRLNPRCLSENELKQKLQEYLAEGDTYPVHRFAAAYPEIEDVQPSTRKEWLASFDKTDAMDTEIKKGVACGKEVLKLINSSYISYSFTPQVFTEAYVDAWKNPEEEVYLVIESLVIYFSCWTAIVMVIQIIGSKQIVISEIISMGY